jgi:CubicO group peptidase (beta-lactamase class C family)
MGMVSTAFLPLNNFPIERIVPTEFDTILRNQLLCGQVNDKVAALFGGISGHAGLFSNAFDMAKFMQMLLWDGEYAGKRYLKPSTIKYFTSRVSERSGNRRGLGFDKPPIIPLKDGPVCKSASPNSFGHSGYTGTYVWADPVNGLVFVFLSNRVYPHADNTQINKLNIRTRIHEKAYELIQKAKGVKL